MIDPQGPDSIRVIPIAELTPDPSNANLGTERGLAMLQASLETLGAGRSILTDKNGVVIAGNKTLESAAGLGITEVVLVPSDGHRLVAVVRTDLDMDNLDDPRARRLAIADNRVGQMDLAWDPAALLDLASRFGDEIHQEFWTPEEWRDQVINQALQAGGYAGREERTSDNSELQQAWNVEAGQTWVIPSATMTGFYHRLYVGDSTDPASIAQALGPGGRLANLLVTSPPYWVGMEYETQDSEGAIEEFIYKACQAWTTGLAKDYGRLVINTGTAAIHRIEKKRPVEIINLVDRWQESLRLTGWLLRHLRVWVKTGGGLRGVTGTLSPHTDAVDQANEHLATFTHKDQDQALDLVDPWAPDSPANGVALQALDWSYLATWWNPAGDYRGQERVGGTEWAQQGVWSDIAGEASADGLHVAAYPIEIPRRFILLYTKLGELVLDPCAGSGTTILAAESVGRLCCGVELSPLYAAAALERFKAAGLVPALEDSE